jgi:hypothetical protein
MFKDIRGLACRISVANLTSQDWNVTVTGILLVLFNESEHFSQEAASGGMDQAFLP